VLPQKHYFGKELPEGKDPYDRRVISKLDDIEFSEDSDDPEELRNLKRLPNTILSEENMKAILNDETVRLNLEAAYWLKPHFVKRIGKMAPNLKELSLRRLDNITNPDFAEIFSHLKAL